MRRFSQELEGSDPAVKPSVLRRDFCIAWGSRREVEAYLYDKNVILSETMPGEYDPVYYLVDCTACAGSGFDAEAQGARLASGMRGAGPFTREQAYENLILTVGVKADPAPPCPACGDLGFQAGAHTERVEPCPSCAPQRYEVYTLRHLSSARSLTAAERAVRCHDEEDGEEGPFLVYDTSTGLKYLYRDGGDAEP